MIYEGSRIFEMDLFINFHFKLMAECHADKVFVLFKLHFISYM